MKFAVINSHQPNYEPLAKLTTWGNRAEYCQRHGYDLHVMTSGWKLPAIHPVTWDRFGYARGILEAYDWIYVCGTDTLHTNLAIPLTKFALPDRHVVFSAEWCGPTQADSFLVRNSPEGRAWMDSILQLYPKYKNHVWVEQQAIIDTLPNWKGVVLSLPQRELNSYEYGLYREQYSGEPNVQKALDCYGNDGEWHQGDFLIHWPGQPLSVRLALANKYTPLIVK